MRRQNPRSTDSSAIAAAPSGRLGCRWQTSGPTDPTRPSQGLPRTPTILVLDDDPAAAAAVGAALSDLGDVYTATTSAQALVLAQVVRPDFAVLDIILPRMDGFAVVEEMRRIPGLAALPVLFITGSDRIDVAVRAREIGVPTVLYKPLDVQALRDAAVQCLRRPDPAVS